MDEAVRLVNEREVSKIIGISATTLRIWRHKRRGIPYVKCGGAVRYRLADVLKYIEANTVHTEVLGEGRE
jgi:hypothetical protein